jgi:hypothetical protein
MAIGRMQMNRQLYGLGSYFPPENGREKFGLGSKLKKFARKIIPNEVSEIAVKAAPFVAPFNPLLAGYMAGIGGFDQTGRIGSSLKSGLLTYGAGQLARGIGGAGTQGGFNPFAGYNPASSFGGISSLFTSPIGTQTGLQLGQYEMFGGPGSGGDQATRKAIGEQLAQTSRDAAVPPGTFIDAGVDSGIKVADYTGELISNTGGEVAKQATRGYMDITKDLFSGDFTTMGNAAKELGGKALKDIYTTPVKPYVDASGNLVDSKLDKTAVIATLSMIPTYLDAKKAADDAGIEEFDEAAYNAERDKYMAQYKSSLPASSFGIQAAANGGRIGYGDGTKPSAEENTPSQEIINRRIAQIKDMSKRGADIDTIKSITGASDQMIKDVLGQANGGRIGYREGTPREGIVSLTDEDSGVIYRDPKTGEPLTTTEFLRRAQEDEDRDNVSLTDEESGVVYEDPKTGKPLTTEEFLRMSQEDEELDFGASSITLPKKKTFRERSMEIAVPKQINREMEDKFENYLKKLVTGKKDGGRIGLAGGGGYYDDDYTAFSLLRDELMQFEGDDYYTATRRAKKAIYGMKDGGRIGYGFGSLVKASDFVKPVEGGSTSSGSGLGNMGLIGKLISQNPNLFKTTPVNMTRGTSVNQLYNYYKDKEFDPEEEKRKQILDLYMRDNAATGGRMGFMMGTEVPMRQNQGGITELDYRKTGGFVPVGVKERADDVPAMLSKNEFVFTADAVRGAGKGDINKGAKMMYAKMKALEGKVKKFKKTKKKKVKV